MQVNSTCLYLELKPSGQESETSSFEIFKIQSARTFTLKNPVTNRIRIQRNIIKISVYEYCLHDDNSYINVQHPTSPGIMRRK